MASNPTGRTLPETDMEELFPRGGVATPVSLDPGEKQRFDFRVEDGGVPKRRFVRIAGRVEGMAGGEEAFRVRGIELRDAASPFDGSGEYSVAIRGIGESGVEQAVFCRIPPEDVRAGKAEIAVSARGDALELGKNGWIGLSLEFFPTSGDAAVETLRVRAVAFDTGSYGWKTFSATVDVPPNAEEVVVGVGGEGFSGSLSFRRPEITLEGGSAALPPIEPETPGPFGWIGTNVARWAWPEFAFRVDGTEFFRGAVFQRAANGNSDFEIEIPPLPAGGHVLEMELSDDWDIGAAYLLYEVDMLAENARAFEIAGYPGFVPENSEFAVMVEINGDGVELKLDASDGAAPLRENAVFPGKGLRAVPFRAGASGSSPVLSFDDGTRVERVRIDLVTDGKGDVLVSTSDWIYIVPGMFERYMKWLHSNGLVNALAIRPSFQWSGTRSADRAFYDEVKAFCEDFRSPYFLMSEGRCLAGTRINPPDEWLEGGLYLGRQAHENDGSYYYWGPGRPYKNPVERLLMERRLDGGGIFPKFQYDPEAAVDMEDAANRFVENLKKAKNHSVRHTGPSVLFRYFLQAGYEWVGAEQCYGPEEIAVSALRGASKAYGKTLYGTHHATQWSSMGVAGYDDPAHAEAQFKSHAVAYMHGSSHINTEDALWNTEDCHWRFSESAMRHASRQKDFMDFVSTHPRHGEMRIKTAVLQGRNDGWALYGNQPVWGQSGEEWESGDAEASFELLKVFHPRAEMGISDFSVSGTPYGPIDILPVEAPAGILESYDTLIFLGWNNYDERCFSNLLRFVRSGGTLLMTRAHLNANTRRSGGIRLPEAKSEFIDALDLETEPSRNARRIPIGLGTVVFFDTDDYPGSVDSRDAYADEMRAIGAETIASERGSGWLKGTDSVGFAAWDAASAGESSRTIFVLNTADGGGGVAKLLLGDAEFAFPARPGTLETVFVSNGVAAWVEEPLARVLEIHVRDGVAKVKVQTPKPCALTLFDGATGGISAARTVSAGTNHVEFSLR